jgi:dihydroorotate dehydrogenase
VFLKVAPDLGRRRRGSDHRRGPEVGLDGVIISNTTVGRPDDLQSAARGEVGGLSGAPLAEASLRALRWFHAAHDDKLVLVAAGGIGSAADAYARIRAGRLRGAALHRAGLRGARLVRRMKRDLAALLRAEGFASVLEARGTDRA